MLTIFVGVNVNAGESRGEEEWRAHGDFRTASSGWNDQGVDLEQAAFVSLQSSNPFYCESRTPGTGVPRSPRSTSAVGTNAASFRSIH